MTTGPSDSITQQPRRRVPVAHGPDMYRAMGPGDGLAALLGVDPSADASREQISIMWLGLGEETQRDLWQSLDEDQRGKIIDAFDANPSDTSDSRDQGSAAQTDAGWYDAGVDDSAGAAAGQDDGSDIGDTDADADGADR